MQRSLRLSSKAEKKDAKRQAVCLNAGAALYITGKAETIEQGVRMAESLIDDGSALRKLEEFITESNRYIKTETENSQEKGEKWQELLIYCWRSQRKRENV